MRAKRHLEVLVAIEGRLLRVELGLVRVEELLLKVGNARAEPSGGEVSEKASAVHSAVRANSALVGFVQGVRFR
jgi:hypothetical protein